MTTLLVIIIGVIGGLLMVKYLPQTFGEYIWNPFVNWCSNAYDKLNNILRR